MWSARLYPHCNKREHMMYDILGADIETNAFDNGLFRNSCVRSYVQISATHISTVMWHYHYKIPFKKLVANDWELQQKGYFMYEDLEARAYLPDDEVNQEHHWGLNTTQVSAMLILVARAVGESAHIVIGRSTWTVTWLIACSAGRGSSEGVQ